MSTVTAPRPTGTGTSRLLTAQLLKLRTPGMLALLALNVLLPLALIALTLHLGQQTFDLTGADLARPLTDGIGDYLLLVPLFGALLVGADHRHGTIVPTLLTEPRRSRVVAAALLAAAGGAAAIAVACALLGAAVALPWLAAQGVPLGEVLADPDLWWRTAAQIAVVVASGLFGAALAALLRGVMAPVLVVTGLLILEGVVHAILGAEWSRWGWFAILQVLADPTAPDPDVPVWQAVVLVVAVLTALVTAALAATTRRDAA